MNIRHVAGAIGAGLLTAGLIAMNPVEGLAQHEGAHGPSFLPADEGPITLHGCFLRVKVGHEGNKFVLAKPQPGPAISVTEPTCSASSADEMVELDDVHDNVHKHHLDRSKVGRWIEVTGRLDKIKSQTLREVHVEDYRIVEVVAPPVARVVPAPPRVIETIPPLEAAPIESPAEVGTAGVTKELPHTASPLPLIGLVGLLAVAASLALNLFRRRAL